MKLSEIKNKTLFAKGKRGLVYTGRYGEKKVSIKQQRKDIPVTWSVKNEADKLKILNKKGIGPRLLASGSDYIVYEFIEGDFLPKFVEKIKDKKRIRQIILEVLRQCFVMDKLKLNKEEMTNPYKHVVVKGKRAALLDFERCRETKKPKNVTQFCQYLISGRFSMLLKKKGFSIDRNKMMQAARNYKNKINTASIEKIKKLII